MTTQEAVLAEPTSAPAVEPALPRSNTMFAATIFISAFLLFQVELIVGKQLLPWFGGTPALWNTCMMFFQVMLLAGYAYAHFLADRLPGRVQTRTHVTVLAMSIVALIVFAFLWRSPIYPGLNWRPENPAAPIWHILALLSVSVGLPFFLLSTTGPLLQSWFARNNPGASPYQLYAMSNLGSLLGLLTYPLLFEPTLSLRSQGRIWSFAYLAAAGLCALCTIRYARSHGDVSSDFSSGAGADLVDGPPSWPQRALWFGLAACGSTMLLAVTNLMCQEIAVVPFLWVLPLSIYLVSFVLCFHETRFYRRGLFHVIFLGVLAWSVVIFYGGGWVSTLIQINSFAVLLFASCMVYHGELAALKPNPRYLTWFYLLLASGGAFGSIFVGLIAPRVFPAIWEFQIGLWVSGLLVAVVLVRDRNSWLYRHPRWLAPAALLAIVAAADYVGVPAKILHLQPVYFHVLAGLLAGVVLGMVFAFRLAPATHRWPVHGILVFAWCLLGLLFWRHAYADELNSVLLSRNFYGTMQAYYVNVTPEHRVLALRHGATLHGTQFLDPQLRSMPTTYFGPHSGIGLLLTDHPRRRSVLSEQRNLRIGIIGLGAGTLAAYGQPGDYIRFYELNPEVARVAYGKEALFQYLNDTPARKDVVLGDARISLERELASGEPQHFDVLAIDAFSSDSIPLHLLTREAMDIYIQHLRDAHSVLAFHITNRALDLRLVLVGLAQQHHLNLLRIRSERPPELGSVSSDWVLMTPDPAGIDVVAIQQFGRHIQLLGPAPLWTDDYSNLLQVLK